MGAINYRGGGRKREDWAFGRNCDRSDSLGEDDADGNIDEEMILKGLLFRYSLRLVGPKLAQRG